jgi:L-lactate dehydrogenase complex protein LldG
MTSEMSSREEILRRVRTATGGASTEKEARTAWNAVPRQYKRKGVRQRELVLELFEDRLRDYDAGVVRCERSDVARSVAGMLSERGKRRLVVPAGLASEWLPANFQFVVDEGFPAIELNGFDGVLTGSSVAIAETGTVVLQNVAGQGRRAVTLVPDYHLCLVRVEDVVETVPEAMDTLRGTSNLATTFVSGPSATADIEMTRIKGVHGPRYLDVILIV